MEELTISRRTLWNPRAIIVTNPVMERNPAVCRRWPLRTLSICLTYSGSLLHDSGSLYAYSRYRITPKPDSWNTIINTAIRISESCSGVTKSNPNMPIVGSLTCVSSVFRLAPQSPNCVLMSGNVRIACIPRKRSVNPMAQPIERLDNPQIPRVPIITGKR